MEHPFDEKAWLPSVSCAAIEKRRRWLVGHSYGII